MKKVALLVLFALLLCYSTALIGKKFKLNTEVRILDGPDGRTQAFQPKVRAADPNLCETNVLFRSVGEWTKIYSPGYPQDYPPYSKCLYTFESPVNTQMTLDCLEFNVEVGTRPDECEFDMFRFSMDGDLTSRNRQYSCGTGEIHQTSIENKIRIYFTSDSTNAGSSRRYFRFSCSVTVLPSKGGPNPVTPKPVTPPPVTQKPVTNPPVQQCSCGKPLLQKEPRIVGGEDAGISNFPWRCVLVHKELGDYCGCTVISPNYVLTAAHCTDAAEDAGGDLFVNIGDYDLRINDEIPNVVVKAQKIMKHEQYDKYSQDNDISLIRLSKTIQFSRNIQPICLPFKYTGKSLHGQTAIATGWGLDKYGGRQTPVLQKASLTIYDTEKCRTSFPGYNQKGLITDNMFCTYEDKGGIRDMCQGDSGGGIDVFDGSSGRYFQVGISSWGIGCAGRNKPGAYVKLTLPKFLDWIKERVGDPLCVVQ